MLPYRLRRIFRRQQRQRRSSMVLWWRRLRWLGLLLLVLIALDIFYLSLHWPDWSSLASGAIPKSAFIQDYEQRRLVDHQLPSLQWKPVADREIPQHLRRAVIAGEDANFYWHNGFDLQAFQTAMNRNLELMKLRYGASTISQQTIKNLFLSSSRSPLRKWHELVMTVAMELNLRKERILDLYLNIAEFGQGVYGVEAAAEHYWHIPVSALHPWQSAQLAACLPSPVKNNPMTATRQFFHRARKIYSAMQYQQKNLN